MLENIVDEDIEFKARDGVKLVATVRGKKGSDKSAVILPGFLANKEAYFDIADSLDDYLCLVLSLRGHGSEGEFDMYKTAGDIILASQALRSDYGAKKTTAVAHSGSSISSLMASTRSHEIDSLCLFSTITQFSEPHSSWLNPIFKFLLHTVGFLPKWASRKIINPLNYPISWISSNYRDLSFRIYKEEINRGEDIFICGLKIGDKKEFAKNCLEGPSAFHYVRDLDKPVLYLYGGNDILLGFNKGKMPEKYQKLIKLSGLDKNNKEVYCVIVDGADHQFNKLTLPDDPLNYSPEFQYVKLLMKDFLDSSLEGRKIELGLEPREPKVISGYPL